MIQSITVLLLLIVNVDAHGRFTSPPPRAISGGGGPNAPTYTCAGPAFGTSATSMRCHDGETPGTITTVTAGQDLTVEWLFEAAHPGDCSIWISYDTDIKSPINWVKLLDMPGCLSPNGQTPTQTSTTVKMPANIPNCDHCVMRWEWYAVQQVTNVEFYVQCFDVKITGGNNNCPKPAPTTAISDIAHLGSCAGTGYYNPYNGAFDPNRSRGPKEFVAPVSCGNGGTIQTQPPSVSTPVPTASPPTRVPTTLSPTKAGETRSPTRPPTPAPTFNTAPTKYVAPFTPPQEISNPVSATATFSGTGVQGTVNIKQYSATSAAFVTVSLKNSDGASTAGNVLSIRTDCTAQSTVMNGGVLSQRYGINYDGRIGNPVSGTTNVQSFSDDQLDLSGANSAVSKGFTVTTSSGTSYCAEIVAEGQSQPADSSSVSIGIVISSILSLICLFF